MATPLIQKQAARLTVLHALYEMTDGDYHTHVEPEEIAQQSGLEPGVVDAALNYLSEEGLVVNASLTSVAITHRGVCEVEAAQTTPNTATEHFPALVINQVFHGPVGAVQTGAGSSANVSQHVGLAPADIAGLLSALRNSIPEDRADLRETVDELEHEAAQPDPKRSRIRAYLTHLWTAARDIATIGQFLLPLAQTYGVTLPGA